MLIGPLLAALVLSLSVTSPLAAQARRAATTDPDMKELAAYTLTIDALNRVDRVNRAALAELQKDPRFVERQKVKSELEALQKKDEPTEAEQKRIEELEAKSEQLDTALSKDDDTGNTQTLSDMERKLNSIAPLASALRKEGMSGREYAKFMLASLQAGMAAAIMKMPGAKKDLPEGINPANVKFMQEHEADFKRLQDTYEAMESGK